MTRRDAVLDRFTDEQRQSWELDRILIEEPDDDAGGQTRFAIDLRAQGGGGHIRPQWERVPVMDVLTGLDDLLDGVAIGRADLWGSDLGHDRLTTLLGLVAMDCDTDHGWEGRLEVHAREDDGTWRREHQVGGFWEARDAITTIAGGRIVVVSGRPGAFLVAVQGPELRYLGQLPVSTINLFESGGRSYIVAQFRYGYEITGIDEVLAAAFARGASPARLDLPEERWPDRL